VEARDTELDWNVSGAKEIRGKPQEGTACMDLYCLLLWMLGYFLGYLYTCMLVGVPQYTLIMNHIFETLG
jgi:hypothetical protein